MHSTLLLTVFGAAALASAGPAPVPGTTGKLGDAAEVTGNPEGITYTAYLPDSPKTGIRGYIAGTSATDGTGVDININFYGFPDASLGPFIYHIHDQPVPADGNCTKTLAHLDPYIRGEVPPCDSTDPASCQSGDLSGKHGNITGGTFQAAYLEPFLSTAKGPASFFGNRSIVIHSSNKTRLTCANFKLTGGSTGNGTNSTGPTVSTPASPPAFTGGAAATFISAGAALAGLFALLL